MRIIDNKNLDEWLFDYFEGNLGAEEKTALTDFMHKNPLLKADYDAWKMSYVQESEIAYPNMESLLRKPGGAKWIKGGLAAVVLISLLLLYLFYKGNENKQESLPDKNAVPVTNRADSALANPANENVMNEKSLSNPAKKTFEPFSVQNNKPVIKPEDMHPVMPTSVGIYFPAAKDSLMSIKLQDEKTKMPPDSGATKKKEKPKKEMKVIKLKNTGL